MSDDVSSRPPTDERAPTGDLDLLAMRDELIGLSAELGEMRARQDTATSRADAAVEAAQRAERLATAASDDTTRFGEYLTAITDDRPAPESPADGTYATRAELVARVDELEAILQRRSVRWPLSITRKLRGS